MQLQSDMFRKKQFITASLSFHRQDFSTTVFRVKIAPFFLSINTRNNIHWYKKKFCLYNNQRTAHPCLPRRFGTPWHSLSPSCWNQSEWWWIGRSNVGCSELGASLSLTYGIYVFPRAGSIHVCCTVRHPSGSAPVKINRYDGQCLHEIQTT